MVTEMVLEQAEQLADELKAA